MGSLVCINREYIVRVLVFFFRILLHVLVSYSYPF